MSSLRGCSPAVFHRESNSGTFDKHLRRARHLSTACALLSGVSSAGTLPTPRWMRVPQVDMDVALLVAIGLISVSIVLEVSAIYLEDAPRLRSFFRGVKQRSALFVVPPGMSACATWLFTQWPSAPVRIVPRTVLGLFGVVCAPMVHDSKEHLLANVTGWVAVMVVLLGFDDRFLRRCGVFVAYSTGIAVWGLARPGYHTGLSGVLFGFVGVLLAAGAAHALRALLQAPDNRRRHVLFVAAVVASFVVLVGRQALLAPGWDMPLYRACVSTKYSAESHFFGFVAGILYTLCDRSWWRAAK
mmetsp:Transcript_19857/g.48233  ORF Transcript_19857/g.48233 Transcript_19857/m.48233 type:complete len:300 (+) Transcript_19857:12-911(+)